jgi:hypothetical protein
MQSLIDKEPRPVEKVLKSKIVRLRPVSDSIRDKIENNDPKEGSYAAVRRWRADKDYNMNSDAAEYQLEMGMVFPNIGALNGEMAEFLFELDVSRLRCYLFFFLL